MHAVHLTHCSVAVVILAQQRGDQTTVPATGNHLEGEVPLSGSEFVATIELHNQKGPFKINAVELRLEHNGHFTTSSATGMTPRTTVRSSRVPLQVCRDGAVHRRHHMPVTRLDFPRYSATSSGMFRSTLAYTSWFLYVYPVFDDGTGTPVEEPTARLEVFVFDDVLESNGNPVCKRMLDSIWRSLAG